MRSTWLGPRRSGSTTAGCRTPRWSAGPCGGSRAGRGTRTAPWPTSAATGCWHRSAGRPSGWPRAAADPWPARPPDSVRPGSVVPVLRRLGPVRDDAAAGHVRLPSATWPSPTRCRSSSGCPGRTTPSATAGPAGSTPRPASTLSARQRIVPAVGTRPRRRSRAARARTADRPSLRRRRPPALPPVGRAPGQAPLRRQDPDARPVHVPAGPDVPRGPLRAPHPRRARRRPVLRLHVVGAGGHRGRRRRMASTGDPRPPRRRSGSAPTGTGRSATRSWSAEPEPIVRRSCAHSSTCHGTTVSSGTTNGPVEVIAATRFPEAHQRLLLPPTAGLRDWRRRDGPGRRRAVRGHRRAGCSTSLGYGRDRAADRCADRVAAARPGCVRRPSADPWTMGQGRGGSSPGSVHRRAGERPVVSARGRGR